MDLHYGNGTASLAPARPLSLHHVDLRQRLRTRTTPFRDVDVVRHTDGANHRSIALPTAAGATPMLAALDDGVGRILAWGRPDLLLYQAGADPYREDPYSPLALDHDDLLARDRRVFECARAAGIPIAWVLAGGYTKDTSKVVRVHLNTFDAAFVRVPLDERSYCARRRCTASATVRGDDCSLRRRLRYTMRRSRRRR